MQPPGIGGAAIDTKLITTTIVAIHTGVIVTEYISAIHRHIAVKHITHPGLKII